ncbi:unnamed protein product [Closterium sp. NIES-65]|nr:unnamed protein product [Closterium sp. NIES-65]
MAKARAAAADGGRAAATAVVEALQDTAEARAAVVDAGRAAATAVVEALQEKLEGFSEAFLERLKGVVGQAVEQASKGGKLEASIAPVSTEFLAEADSPDIPIAAAQKVMERFVATPEDKGGEAGEVGAGVAGVDLSGPVRRDWRETFAAKELQKEKEKERLEKMAAKTRKQTAFHRARMVGNAMVEAQRLGNQRESGKKRQRGEDEGRRLEERRVQREREEKQRKEEGQRKREEEKAERKKEEKRQMEEEKRKRDEEQAVEREKEEKRQRQEEEQKREEERLHRENQERKQKEEDERKREERQVERERGEKQKREEQRQ